MNWGFGYNGMMGFGLWGMLLMAFFWLLIIVGIIVLVYWLVKSSAGASGPVAPPSGARDDPLAILKLRLARGEITEDEYDRLAKKVK